MMHVTDTPNGGRYPWVDIKVGENPIAIPSIWGNVSVDHLTWRPRESHSGLDFYDWAGTDYFGLGWVPNMRSCLMNGRAIY